MNETLNKPTTAHSLNGVAATLTQMGKPKLARELERAARDFAALEKRARELEERLTITALGHHCFSRQQNGKQFSECEHAICRDARALLEAK